PYHVSLSPDGRYIAYDRAEDPGDTDRGIYLSTIDGSQEIPIVTGPAYDSHPIWTPEGSGLVFASLRTGGPGIWLQPIKDGRADGNPRLLDKDMGPFDPITLTRHGALFYRHRTGLMDVYTVPIDPATGDVRGEPTVVARRFLGTNISPDWSPDGRHAYLKRDQQKISRMDVGTEEEEVLYHPPADSVLGNLAVSPDDRSITFNLYLRAEKRFRLFVIAAGGGAPRELSDVSG